MRPDMIYCVFTIFPSSTTKQSRGHTLFRSEKEKKPLTNATFFFSFSPKGQWQPSFSCHFLAHGQSSTVFQCLWMGHCPNSITLPYETRQVGFGGGVKVKLTADTFRDGLYLYMNVKEPFPF